MARRIQPIFDTVLASDRLTASDRKFVKSLQAYYKSTGRLTPGRRIALLKVEGRLQRPAAVIDPKVEKDLADILGRAEKAGDNWAIEFVKSVRVQLLNGRTPSQSQTACLDKVRARHSDVAQTERDNWTSSFTSEMREKMVIAANYYIANPPYYGELARKALDSEFVPSKRQYEKLVENKYATKVIASTLAPPKYAVGSQVQLRSTAPLRTYRLAHRHGRALILKSNAKPVSSPARGSKVYSVLFFGEALPVFVEERHIKKARG